MSKDEPKGRERRKSLRFDARFDVDYASGDTFLFSYITNISNMGIFVRSEEPLAVGTRLALRFGPKGEAPLELTGEVAWINPMKSTDAENLNPGMGIRFVDLTPAQRERVVELVRTVAYLRDDADAD